MKRIFLLFLLSGAILTQGQTFDRISISAGGTVIFGMNVTIGEVFAGSFIKGNVSLDLGAASDTQYTGRAIETPVKPITNSNLTISLYPNPVKDFLQISLKGTAPCHLDLCVFDCMGKQLVHQPNIAATGLITLPLTDLPHGIYILYLKSENGKALSTLKFLKI